MLRPEVPDANQNYQLDA